MSLDDDISRLMDFGLTSLQSRVYLALLRLGSATARQVSSTMGIVRPETYRVLRELSLRGLVECNLGLPSTYTAAPPEQGVSFLLRSFAQKMSLLEQEKMELVESLASHASDMLAQPRQRFNRVTGSANVMGRLEEMIAAAKRDCVGITSKYGLRRLNGELVSAANRKVRIRLISEIDASNMANAIYLSRHVELRRSRNVLICFRIVDQREMVLGPPITDEEASKRNWREDDLWTNNLRFVGGMYGLFERLWKTCPDYMPPARSQGAKVRQLVKSLSSTRTK